MPGNPFRPGYGRMPPLLAGRGRAQNELNKTLSDLCNNDDTPNGVLISGPRGMGKTVLLEWFMGAANPAAKQIRTSPVRIINIPMLASVIDSYWHAEQRASSITVGGTILGFGGTVAQSRGEAVIPGWEEAIYQKLLADHPGDALGDQRSPLIIAVDEAHTLDPDVAVTLLNIHQELVAKKSPVCLILVGTPDMADRLRIAGKPSNEGPDRHSSAATFVGRAKKISLLSLDDAASLNALLIPLQENGCSVQEETLQPLLDMAQNSPYFIQVAGDAVWDAAQKNNGYVEAATVAQAMTTLEDEVGGTYRERFDELNAPLENATRAQCLAAAYAVAQVWLESEGQPISMSQMTECFIGSGLPDAAHRSLEQRFKHTGYMVELTEGAKGDPLWTPGIPSLANYINKYTTKVMISKTSPSQGMDNSIVSVRSRRVCRV